MSLGHLFATHKVVGSCVSYIGISIIMSILNNIMSAILSSVVPRQFYYMTSYGMMEAMSSLYLLYMMLVSVIEIIIFHVITERILSKKLNLE